MKRNASTLLLVPSLFLFACGGSAPAPVDPSTTQAQTPTVPEAPATPAADAPSTAAPAATPAPDAAAATPAPAAPAAPPTVKLAGNSLELAYGGATYALTSNAVVPQGKEWEIHFEQPMDAGYNQIWLMPRGVKKGQPAKVEGSGMSALFVQLAKGKGDVQNVSNSCSATGTVTFADVPKPGKTAKGTVDVTITCRDVPALSAPIVVKGSFADVPVKK